jgi:hypothetical protein
VKTHLLTTSKLGDEITACRRSMSDSPRGGKPPVTTDPAKVTCRVCRHSVYWVWDIAPHLEPRFEDMPRPEQIVKDYAPINSPFLEAIEEC